jgi:hypothetical protein
VDTQAIETALVVFGGLFRAFGLIQGGLVSPDGQLELSYARFKGCVYCCQDCRQFLVAESSPQKLCRQLQAEAKRLELLCPVPKVVQKVRQASTKKGQPREPKVALLDNGYLPSNSAETAGPQHLSKLLSLPKDRLLPLRIKWSHLAKGPQGELWGPLPRGLFNSIDENCVRSPIGLESAHHQISSSIAFYVQICRRPTIRPPGMGLSHTRGVGRNLLPGATAGLPGPLLARCDQIATIAYCSVAACSGEMYHNTTW